MATIILIREGKRVLGLNADQVVTFVYCPPWTDETGKNSDLLEVSFSDGTVIKYRGVEALHVLSFLESLAVSPRPEVG